jgi:integrase/recombinase XerD
VNIEDFFVEHTFAGETEYKYRRVLTRIGQVCGDLEALSAAELKAWLFGQGWGSSSRWVAFCAIRKYLTWRFGQHPALALRLKREESQMQRSLSAEQALQLLASFKLETCKGIRDLAMCALMLDSGLRCSEVCRCDLAKLDLVQSRLTVKIKGSRPGLAVFSELTGSYLQSWLDVRQDVLECDSPALFVSVGGNTPRQRLTRSGLQLIVKRWGECIGIRLSPHDLRRTFAILALKRGAPTRVLQEAGRWRSVAMVELYTRGISAEEFRRYFPVAGVVSGT